MILAIDIGNTNIVLGCVEGKKTFFIERLSTDKAKTELEYAVSLKNVLEIYEIPVDQIEGGIISSVVPQVTELCRSAAEKVIKKPVKVVGPGVKTGLNIKLDDPATAGSDLVVVAVAALNEYTCPQIVIDMGTATTMSVLDQKGCFIGGVILPGLRTSLDALVSNAAQLSQTSLATPKKVIGKNTLDCLRGGMIYGNAASIDGMIERMEEELGCKCTIVATGGLAQAVIPHCRHNIIIDEDLLLKGLQIIYEKEQIKIRLQIRSLTKSANCYNICITIRYEKAGCNYVLRDNTDRLQQRRSDLYPAAESDHSGHCHFAGFRKGIPYLPSGSSQTISESICIP